MMAATLLAMALGGREVGGAWMARCPAHDDRRPSLSIDETADGRVLVHCHAGCDQRDVIAVLRDRDLWQTTTQEYGTPPYHRRRIARESDAGALKRSAVAQAIWQSSQPAQGTIAEAYLRSRGLDLPTTSVLRFHPRLKHPSGGLWPAMVSLPKASRQ